LNTVLHIFDIPKNSTWLRVRVRPAVPSSTAQTILLLGICFSIYVSAFAIHVRVRLSAAGSVPTLVAPYVVAVRPLWSAARSMLAFVMRSTIVSVSSVTLVSCVLRLTISEHLFISMAGGHITPGSVAVLVASIVCHDLWFTMSTTAKSAFVLFAPSVG